MGDLVVEKNKKTSLAAYIVEKRKGSTGMEYLIRYAGQLSKWDTWLGQDKLAAPSKKRARKKT